MSSIIIKYWNLSLVLILILGGFVIYLSKETDNNSNYGNIVAPHQGFFAPEFTLQSIDGSTYSLSDFRGNSVLLNFWTSWCPPCRSEMPEMQKVYSEYRDKDFVILAVNSTFQDSEENAVNFVQEHHLTFPILLDTQGDATRAYQVMSLPTTFLIDQDGIIQDVVVGGPMPEALLRDKIEKLITHD